MLRNQLKPAIRRKFRSLLSSGVGLQYDNARPHTALHIMKEIQSSQLEVLFHSLFSPDVAPGMCHFFWPLKDALRGGDFRSDKEVKKAVHDWLAQRP
jgi:hypothetical protein